VIKLASDENFDGDVVRGLLRRVPELDMVRIQDAELAGSPDPTILAWAANENRIVLTHDRDTMPNFVYERVIAGEPMPGVFLVSNRRGCQTPTVWQGLPDTHRLAKGLPDTHRLAKGGGCQTPTVWRRAGAGNSCLEPLRQRDVAGVWPFGNRGAQRGFWSPWSMRVRSPWSMRVWKPGCLETPSSRPTRDDRPADALARAG